MMTFQRFLQCFFAGATSNEFIIRDIVTIGFMDEIRQILKKKKILFVFKGYTYRFKSEAFASIALRP